MKHTERNFWLDVGLFVAFLAIVFTGFLLWRLIPDQAAATFVGFTRQRWLTAHICWALASAAGVAIHLAWHRDWFKSLRKRPMASLPPKLRANRVVDQVVWITFLATGAFGALSRMIPAGENGVSLAGRLHVALGMAALLEVAMHLALHRQWIISALKRRLPVIKGDRVIIPPGGVKDLPISNR
jgi:hypothetical protein